MSRVHPPPPQLYYSWLSSLPLLGIVLQPMCAVPFSRYWLLSFTKNQAKEISDIEDVSTDWFPASRQTLSTASDSRIPYTTNRPASVLPTALAQNPPLRTKLGDTPATAAIPMWTILPSPSSTFSLSPSFVRVNSTATISAQYSRCTSSWSRLKNSRPASPPLFYTKWWCTIVQLHLERNPLSPSLVPGGRPQRYGSGFNFTPCTLIQLSKRELWG